MEIIIYQNLVGLILEKEGEQTEEEIKKIAIEKFGFPDRDYLSVNIQLSLIIGKGYNYELLKNGKYRFLRKDDEDREDKKLLLKALNNASDEYFERKPYIKKLKEALVDNKI